MSKDTDRLNALTTRCEPLPGGRWFAGRTSLLIAILIATVCGGLVYRESPLAFLSAMTDGLLAAAVLAAASLAGLWIVWVSGNGDLPARWQIGLGAGAGIGALSLGMLWAGLHGWMGQATWWVIIGVMAAAGLLALQRLSQKAAWNALATPADSDTATAGPWHWLWLLIIPAVVLGVLAATVPPGMLWHEEGNGYDVLEYHLGVPKEYVVSGRITYLDHNMYSNFPMNAEMLYLLKMVLYASPYKAAIPSQMIHLLLGALAGYAAWLIGRDYSRKAGILAGIAGATFPWAAYLGGLAYVENGMLFYGLLAAGLCNRAIRDSGERRGSRALALGAMAGLACGYKYTAIPMIAVPLLVLWFLLNVAHRPRRLRTAVLPLLIAAAAFGPWMVKNQRMTGDPFFPLGYRVFGSHVWTDADYAKFVRGHSSLPQERPAAARARILWQRVLAEPRFGYLPWLAAATAGVLALRRRTACRKEIGIWLAVLAAQLLLWLFTTHLFARFASIMWIPLIQLMAALAAWLTADKQKQRQGEGETGRKAEKAKAARSDRTPTTAAAHAWRPTTGMAVCLLGLLAYVTVGQGWLLREYRQRMYVQGRLLPLHGHTELFYRGQVANHDHLEFINGNGQDQPGLPKDARLLMVNDVCAFYVDRPCDYFVVFSHNRFAEAVDKSGGSAERVLAWLREQGYTHVWVSLPGMGRQGDPHIQVPPEITPELFVRLEKAGLKRLQEVRLGGNGEVYGILYEVGRP
jgi:hypothetical protein